MTRKRGMQDIFDILADPSALFERVKVMPRWIPPFSTVAMVLVGITWIKSCLHTQGLVLSLMPLVAAGIVLPIVITIVWLGLSGFLYAIIELLKPDGRPGFKQIFSVVAHCGIIFGLGELVNFLLTQNLLFDAARFPVINRFPVGLDLFVWGKTVPTLVAILLHSVNIFTVWYLALLAIGLRVVGGISRVESTMLAASVWFVGMAMVGATIAILGGTTIGVNMNP